MSPPVLFVADLHLGHRSILAHTARTPGAYRGGQTVHEHDLWVLDRLMAANPGKNTLWYFLGDVAMSLSQMDLLKQVPGRKILVRGNHDRFQVGQYLKVFEQIEGILKKYGLWISHAPIHPTELWGKPNVHGHAHYNQLKENQWYLNVSIEWLPDHLPITLDQVRSYFDMEV